MSEENQTGKRVLIVAVLRGCVLRRTTAPAGGRCRNDRGPYVSFPNCGLPCFVGNVIQGEQKLLVASAELFNTRFNIEVRTENEVMAIDRERREIEVKRLHTGEVYGEKYDALILSPGAAAIRPHLPGIDLPGIFVLRTILDSRNIRFWIEQREVERAVIIGGGFVGLEMANNLTCSRNLRDGCAEAASGVATA